MESKIDSFSGTYRFLSNFWGKSLRYEGRNYPTAEHAYQAAKTNNEKEKRRFEEYRLTAGQAKQAGKLVRMRPDWEDVKVLIMTDIVRAKFKDSHLAKKLLATEDLYIEEGNYWRDTFWGVYKGRGLNHLGKILMKIRQELKEETDE